MSLYPAFLPLNEGCGGVPDPYEISPPADDLYSQMFVTSEQRYAQVNKSGTGFTYGTTSLWFKVADITGTSQTLLSHALSVSAGISLYLRPDGGVQFHNGSSGAAGLNGSPVKIRDTSTWQHLHHILRQDGTQNFYLNGEDITDTFTTQNAGALTGFYASSNFITLGVSKLTNNALYTPFGGYMSRVAYAPGAEIEVDECGYTAALTGKWTPQDPSAGHFLNDNAFYLKAQHDVRSAMHPVFEYKGNQTDLYLNNLVDGDLAFTILKENTEAGAPSLHSRELWSGSTTDALVPSDASAAVSIPATFLPGGFHLGPSTNSNEEGVGFTGIGFKSGPGTGIHQALITTEVTGETAVSHPLGDAVKMAWVKRKDATGGWFVWVDGFTDSNQNLFVDTSAGITTNASVWGTTPATATQFNLGTSFAGGNDYLVILFAEVNDLIKFGTFDQDTTDLPIGFVPSMFLTKHMSTAASDWNMFVNPTPASSKLMGLHNTSQVVDSTTATLSSNDPTAMDVTTYNGPGVWMYMAVADTDRYRDFWAPLHGAAELTTFNFDVDRATSADCPEDNHCTLDSLYASQSPGYGTLFTDNGALRLPRDRAQAARTSLTMPFHKDKPTYVEYQLMSASGSTATNYVQGVFGFSAQDGNGVALPIISIANAGDAGYSNGQGAGDVWGVFYEPTTGTVEFYKNGTLYRSQVLPEENRADLHCVVPSDAWSASDAEWQCNFGQYNFAFPPNKPHYGLKASLQSSMYPIVDPSLFFDVLIYTGTGVAGQKVPGLKFRPDLMAIKEIGNTQSWDWFDVVRGINESVTSNGQFAGPVANFFQSWDSDGFTLDTHGAVNTNGTVYMALCWKASACSGLEIQTHTGDGTGNRTFVHGLGKRPDVIMSRERDIGASSWDVWLDGFGDNDRIFLNTNGPIASGGSTAFIDVGITDGAYELGTVNNVTGVDYVVYLWTSIPGFSDFGRYLGNGSTDGAKVFTGFESAAVVRKYLSGGGSAGAWYVSTPELNEGRCTLTDMLYFNTNAAASAAGELDVNANGLKMRSGSANAAGYSYLHMAWARNGHPFATAN